MGVRRRLARRAVVAAVCTAALALAVAAERSSEQRGNRLYRSGGLEEAAGLYRAHVAADTTVARLRYNLGTALLRLASESAEPELVRAGDGADVEVRARASYNLALWHLTRALDAGRPDSVRAHAALSVEAGKVALRLRPGRAEARWNLAIAQRMLDSIDTAEGRAGTESVDGTAAPDDLVASDELRELEDESEVGDAPRRGADEALATSDERAPLSRLEAESILGTGHLDPSTIVRKLLTYEGRVHRRPRVSPPDRRW